MLADIRQSTEAFLDRSVDHRRFAGQSSRAIGGLLRAQPDFRVVGEATNGLEALHLIEQSTPDVVITDIFMPQQDGFETLSLMRKEFPQVPVIVMSAGSSFKTSLNHDYLGTAVALGAARVLRKPFEIPELLALVHEVLSMGDRS